METSKSDLSDRDRKGGVITAILDEVYPINDGMPVAAVESIDVQRQTLVRRAGLNSMELSELEAIWLAHHDSLPYSPKV